MLDSTTEVIVLRRGGIGTLLPSLVNPWYFNFFTKDLCISRFRYGITTKITLLAALCRELRKSTGEQKDFDIKLFQRKCTVYKVLLQENMFDSNLYFEKI